MMARLITWWVFFRISVEERLVYRGDFFIGTLMRFLPIITQIFMWSAIFESVDARDGEVGKTSIEGYLYNDIVAYYLLVTISRAFSSMPGLTSGIARQIRTGEVKKFLIQPVDMVGCLLLQRMAHKLVYYLIAIIPFTLVFYLCRGFFTAGWPSADVMFVFIASLFLSFLLGYFLEACMGLVGFWFLEITSLTFVYMLLNFFLSGHMFPLDMLPTEPVNFQLMVDYLPFKFLAYYPAAVFLGKVSTVGMYVGLAVEAAWVTFFILLARWLWWRGVQRYSGFGG
jgi:ABC-2 type transport system permease protein